MVEVLKKSVKLMDWLIIAAGVFWLGNMDFENLGTSEMAYIAVFALWILMLFIRVYIIYKNDGGKK